jgi:hypothetical protein
MDPFIIAARIANTIKFQYDGQFVNLNELTKEEIQEILDKKRAQLAQYMDPNSNASRRCQSNAERQNIINNTEAAIHTLEVEYDKRNKQDVLDEIDQEASRDLQRQD